MKNKTLGETLKNWPIKKKLVGAFGVLIGAAFLIIVALLIGMQTINNRLTELYEGPTMNIYYSAQMYHPQLDIQRMVNRTLAAGVENLDTMYPQLEQTINENLKIMDEAYAILQETLLLQENKDKLEAVNKKLTDEVTRYRIRVLELIEQGDFEAAMEYNDTYYKPAVDATKLLIEELEGSVLNVALDYEKSSTMLANVMVIAGVAALILITTVACILALNVIKCITEPVAQIKAAAEQLRIGDLSHADCITYESEDELGVLARTMRESITILDGYVKEISTEFERVAEGDLTKNFREITDFLGDFASIKASFVTVLKEFNETLAKIQETSSQVDSGSDEVANAASDLASGTGEQASAVEELTATVETVSSMANEAAKEAEATYNTMMQSVAEAQEERNQMQELQTEMHRIKEISGEIEAIITSIEEIASQTSLLSLNASIEAARAGDAGRGFAVVADQIGKLATDSARAVVNTKELIGKTVEAIDKGNKVTEKTAVGFERIIKELETFAEASKANSEVSKAQSMALTQVEEGIDQISLVTQQNAAASEECSAIGEELAARAVELDNLVGRFKLYNSK